MGPPDFRSIAQKEASACGTIREALDGAVFIENCIPENLELKRKILNEIETGATMDAPIDHNFRNPPK